MVLELIEDVFPSYKSWVTTQWDNPDWLRSLGCARDEVLYISIALQRVQKFQLSNLQFQYIANISPSLVSCALGFNLELQSEEVDKSIQGGLQLI